MSKSEVYRERVQNGERPVNDKRANAMKRLRTNEALEEENAELKDKLAAAKKVVEAAEWYQRTSYGDDPQAQGFLDKALKEYEELSK